MDAIILSLLGWLNLYTDYDTHVNLPNIVITEKANMCRSYGIKDAGTCEATKLKGFYNESVTIYLHANFNPQDLQDQSRLLHELVHYVQWHNGVDESACWGALEVEAYNLQDEWRIQNGMADITDPFKLVMLEAACDDA
ncbi:MAG: hypothetical protein PVF28_03395 [Thioalkalispiraceae bacterium]|jgi:hypothetical protein